MYFTQLLTPKFMYLNLNSLLSILIYTTTLKLKTHSHITLIPNNKILNYISSNSFMVMDLIPFIIILSIGLLSLNSSLLLFLVAYFLNSTQPGGGCLLGIMVMVRFCELGLLVWALGASTSIRSSSQSDL